MTHITQAILDRAVQAQPDIFDSHDVIRFLYTKYQHEYLSELNRNNSSLYPFTETHRQIGIALGKMASIVKLAEVSSTKTMLAENTPVGKWSKRTVNPAQQPVPPLAAPPDTHSVLRVPNHTPPGERDFSDGQP